MSHPALARQLSVALLVLFVGCGEATEDDEASGPDSVPAGAEVAGATDPCEVLDPADIREVTGSEPGSPEAVTPVAGGVSYCEWPMASDTSRTLVTVMAFPAPAMTFPEYLEQTRSVLEEGFDEADYESVEGVGSAAVWSYGSTLQAWGEGHMVQIQSGIGGPALDQGASAELARRALDRL